MGQGRFRLLSGAGLRWLGLDRCRFKGLHPGRRTATRNHGHNRRRFGLGSLFLSQEFFHSLFIKFIGFTLNDRKRILRAFSQAGAQTVAINISNDTGLAVYDFEGTLGT